MTMPTINLGPAMPEIIMTCAAILIMMLDLFVEDKCKVAYATIASGLVVGWSLFVYSGTTFGGSFLADGYAAFFKLVFIVNLVLCTLVSMRYISIEKSNYGEYYSLLMFATLGMMIMASAGDLIQIYVGLELMAISTYILAGFIRHQIRSNEAAMKYLLLGAFASGFLLYGISILYGITGTTDIKGIAAYVSANGMAENNAMLIGIIFLTVAFSFKVAAAPFHMWAPDVYEGAPTSVTAFMSVGPKAAGFAAIGRVFLIALGAVQVEWAHLLIPIAILTMAVGNIVALAQTNIKRMLAYSSIAHAGYVLVGIVAGGPEGVAGVMNYMLAYAFMNIGAFAIVILLRREGFMGESINDFEGLAKTHPVYAALMLVFMFSLTGIPPTAGFMAKFYLFMAAVKAGYAWLVVIAVLFSAISAYYYLRIVMYMYMREPKGDVVMQGSAGLNTAIGLSAAGVLIIGVVPAAVIEMARNAAKIF